MDLNDVAAMTKRIASKQGWNAFLPTLIDPDAKTILALDGITQGVQHKTAALDWMKDKAGSKHCVYLAYLTVDGIEVCQCRAGSVLKYIVITPAA